MGLFMSVSVGAARRALEELLGGVEDVKKQVEAQDFVLSPQSTGRGFAAEGARLVALFAAIYQGNLDQITNLADSLQAAQRDLEIIVETDKENAADVKRSVQ